MTSRLALCAPALLLLATACITTSPELIERPGVERVLDDWHRAASVADGERYFGAFADDAVFLGTDATEHWSLEAFRAYAEPYFERGQGWTYEPYDRNLWFSGDGRTVWFDERLRSAKYGELRGTGVLRRISGEWHIAHYSMSFPIPNGVTDEVVERIRAAR